MRSTHTLTAVVLLFLGPQFSQGLKQQKSQYPEGFYYDGTKDLFPHLIDEKPLRCQKRVKKNVCDFINKCFLKIDVSDGWRRSQG